MKNLRPKKQVLVGDRMMTVYSIGWLGILTNKGNANIRKWERTGVLPKPLLVIEGETRRFYLAAELLGYSALYAASGIRAGIPIKASKFHLKCQRFQRDLKRLLKESPEKLVEKLPQEEAIDRGVSKKKERDLLQKAQLVIGKILKSDKLNTHENKTSKGRRRAR